LRSESIDHEKTLKRNIFHFNRLLTIYCVGPFDKVMK